MAAIGLWRRVWGSGLRQAGFRVLEARSLDAWLGAYLRLGLGALRFRLLGLVGNMLGCKRCQTI